MKPAGLQDWESILVETQADPPHTQGTFGDRCGSSLSSELRVISLNIAGLPHTNNNPKNDRLRKFLNSENPDIVLLQELDTAWHLLASENRLQDRLRAWFPVSKSVCAWYSKYPALRSPRQFGGTAIIVLNHAVSRVVSSGVDETGLGRWCWVRLKGKDNSFFRVVSGYRPVFNDRDDFSVYNQHQYFFSSQLQDYTLCPRKQFTIDLQSALAEFKQVGDDICLGMDYNDEIRTDASFQTLLSEVHLYDAILARHGLDGPPTRQGGSKVIDSLSLTTSLGILRSGYLDFEEGVSDHRPLFVILQVTHVFGQNKAAPKKFEVRRLNGEDPRTVKRYTAAYDAYLVKHKLYSRANVLEHTVTDGQALTSEQQREFESIDTSRKIGMEIAENKCRKIKAGKLSWSKALQDAMDVNRFWQLVLLRWDGHNISASRVSRLSRRLQIEDSNPTERYKILQRGNEAQLTYNRKKKDATSLRGQWLHDLAAARAEAGLEAPAKAIHNLIQKEKSRKAHRIIKNVMNSDGRRSVTTVSSTIDGRETTHLKQEDIEQASLREFDQRIRQANNTPLQSETAIELLGPTGMSTLADDILRTGKVPEELANLDPFLEDYLASHAHGTTSYITDELTTAAHKSGWKKAKERTSSGRSGIHFGHFMAGTHHANIAAFEACMSSIPWRTGYSPQRWRQSMDVMIEKKPGDYHVNRLRTIMLFEADFNQGNKNIGRNLMRNAELKGLLAPEQYGSRKYYTAINQGLNKRLTFDLFRQRKQRGALASTDAKSCYDRIVHIAASLAMRRAGASKSSVQCMLSTLQQIKHYIRTGFGDSVTYFDSDDGSGTPVHGVGQGNGAGPTIWALVSTPIFDSLRRRGYGLFLKCPISGELLHFAGYAFVDDADLAVTDHSLLYDDSNNDIFDLMQNSVTLWEGFIRASGGAIRPDKSHWFLIDFEWEQGRWSYVEHKLEEAPVLQVCNPEGHLETIERIPNDKAVRTVGVRLAPDGNDVDQLEFMTQQVKTWTEKIKTTRLPRDLVWISFTTGILRKLAFPLPATTLSKNECEDLMSPLLLAALPSVGLNRYYPRVLVHAPLAVLGLAIPHLYVEQGISHLQRLIDCQHRDSDITGFLTRCSNEQLTLELGCSQSAFQQDYMVWRTLATACWLTHVWDFAHDYNISVKTPLMTVPLLRADDKYFMEAAVDAGMSFPPLLESINRCRLYLGIARISDILTASGREIRRDVWDRKKATRRNASFDWPRQGNPSETDWQHWEGTVCEMFGLQLPLLQIAQRAGCVLHPTKDWEWFISTDNTKLIKVQKNSTIIVHRLQSRDRREQKYENQGTECSLSRIYKDSWHPVDSEERSTHVAVTSRSSQTVSGVEFFDLEFPIKTLQQFRCDRFRRVTTWCFQYSFCDMTDSVIHNFIHCLSTTGVDAVSDGSSKDGKGSAAWIINYFEANLGGGFKVPGDEDDQDSFRSEMGGLLAILAVIQAAVSVFHVSHPRVTIACDGESALKRSLYNERPASLTDSHWDILDLLQQHLKKMPTLSLEWFHVTGHQDDDPKSELDIWARWNILMDVRAKWCRVQPGESVQIPGYKRQWSVEINGKRMVRNSVAKLRYHCLAPQAIQYWQEKGKAGSSTTSISWSSVGTALAETPTNRRRWVSKHSSGWSPTNRNMVRWKFDTDHRCPRCLAPNEHSVHVWMCQGITARKLWEERCATLAVFLEQRKTCPDIKDVILSRFRTWRARSRPYRFPNVRFPGLQQALQVQDGIGWDSAFEGRWSSHWTEVQQRYYQFINSRRTGERWLIAVIKKVWDIAWDLWEDRNAINVERRTVRQRQVLLQKVASEFETGCTGLTNKGKQLFTRYTLQTRMHHSTQTLESWLLRVEMARQESEQMGVNSEQESEWSRKRREKQESMQKRNRVQAQLQLHMSAWLQRDQATT